MFTISFRQYQIILHCYRGNGLLEGFYIQQRRDPELTPCQRELKFDVLPYTTTLRHSSVSLSVSILTAIFQVNLG